MYLDYGNNKETGKREKITKNFKSIKSARNCLKDFNAEKRLAKKKNIDFNAPKKITLKEYINHWKDVEKRDIRETTLYGYNNIINNHILPYFGDTELIDINQVMIKKYFAYVSDVKKLSNNTIRKHYDLLNDVLNTAFCNEYIVSNPVKKVPKMKKIKKKMSVYSPEELNELIELSKGDRLEIIICLGGLMGLRRGEIAGLRWENVNLKDKIIYIRNSRTQSGKNTVEDNVKTDTSNRVLCIPEKLYLL